MSDGHGAVGDARKAIWEAQAACLPPNDYGKRRGDAGDLVGPQIGAGVVAHNSIPRYESSLTIHDHAELDAAMWPTNGPFAEVCEAVANIVARHVAPLAEQVTHKSNLAAENLRRAEKAEAELDSMHVRLAESEKSFMEAFRRARTAEAGIQEADALLAAADARYTALVARITALRDEYDETGGVRLIDASVMVSDLAEVKALREARDAINDELIPDDDHPIDKGFNIAVRSISAALTDRIEAQG
jgi:hypothetical protein